ncbi:PepSY-associated TM helix domain-containing protein [Zunongwangia atlantica]|uniref:Sulfite reductase flavoprotein component n=1 Tax=Zunongwangia atlantica 22II14-10F7 TaxID=1185767 RepID=A0A1Y1T282_9FLAO|nr:PepSY-associated TM helix domain-containing protein [Zunongwangia atlantica]ORL44724.1 sulfite reductase flavoprotein component [Zunongwangia atlantica 22II14-10F7]
MKKKKKYGLRAFINDVHLWLGLASGIILFLVCLSGTILTFEEEIKGFFAEKFTVEAGDKKLSVEQLISALESEGIVSSVTVPAEEGEAYEFSVKESPEQRRGSTYYVNPYTAEFSKTQESSLDGFFFSMFKLHRWLLLDSSIGRPIVGVSTIIFLILSITGIVLWFPKKNIKWKTLKPGFKIKFSARWKRINHDLHNTLGFYACIFLVVMSLTGLCWSFQWYRDLGSEVMGAQIFGGRGGPRVESEAQIGEDEVISIAEVEKITAQELNYEGKTSISFPSGDKGVYSIRKYESAKLSPIIADNLIVDRDGKVLKKEIFNDKPLNVRITSLIKPLHTGAIYGGFSKFIYFLACLIATSLPITGTFIWLNKMKKKPKIKKA